MAVIMLNLWILPRAKATILVTLPVIGVLIAGFALFVPYHGRTMLWKYPRAALICVLVLETLLFAAAFLGLLF